MNDCTQNCKEEIPICKEEMPLNKIKKIKIKRVVITSECGKDVELEIVDANGELIEIGSFQFCFCVVNGSCEMIELGTGASAGTSVFRVNEKEKIKIELVKKVEERIRDEKMRPAIKRMKQKMEKCGILFPVNKPIKNK